ncbi:MAG TPA: mannose-1-phosphate guanyltransferase [Candidatus Nitrosocosmicus sp.]|jgi:mannose-1-phosphate guanylyltransferase/phosphomannomutase|nr:mannose-1-phosphate guanyltransferase [Candidatus Nitrosocosmicus sp.]
MKAVIMAGGFGTRLRPLTTHIPKPLVPVGNVPIMEHTVRLLKRHGFTDLLVLLYFLPETITGYFGDGSRWGVSMTYATPTADLGTAGAVKYAAGDLGEPVLVISGDVLTDFDLAAAVRSHRDRAAEATMVLTRVDSPLAYGIVITDESGRIVRFLEKPSWGEVFSDTINTGIYILDPAVLGAVPAGRPYDFGKELFPALLASGRPLYGYVAEGYWRDVGDLTEYRTAHLDLLQQRVGVDIPGTLTEAPGYRAWVGEGARVDFLAKLSGSVIIGPGAQVAAGVRLDNCVIGHDSNIAAGAEIEGSVLWDHVDVGAGARVKEAIVGTRAQIRPHAFIAEGVVIGDYAKIGESSTVKANAKVWPYKEVEDGATLAMSLVWAERWSRSIFGRYGVSGLANIEISPEFAAKLGAAFGATVGKRRTMITSRDHHKASRMINRALMAGLLSVGVDVQDLGVAPVSVVRYQISALGLAGGVHVRKSPYDAQLIDIKFFDARGLECAPDREKSVERLFFMEDFYRAPMEETGVLTFPHAGTDRYRDGLLKSVDAEVIKRAGLRMVLDYGFGSASAIFPGVLGALGVEVISLNAYLDESRITKTADEFQRSLTQLSNIVRTLGADLGVLLDTGAEKVFLVDEKGDIIPGDLALALIALLVMRTQPAGRIVVPVTASRTIERLAEEHGFQVTRSRGTPRALTEAALAEDVVLVGEELGGVIFPRFQPAFDGMAAVVRILEMMARLDVRLHQLTRAVPESHVVRLEVPCPNERKGTVMRRLMEATKGEDVELIEGVRVRRAEEWVAATPDADRACFHVVAEAGDKERARALAEEFRDKIAGWRRDTA